MLTQREALDCFNWATDYLMPRWCHGTTMVIPFRICLFLIRRGCVNLPHGVGYPHSEVDAIHKAIGFGARRTQDGLRQLLVLGVVIEQRQYDEICYYVNRQWRDPKEHLNNTEG